MTTSQARDCGIDERTFRGRVRREGWVQLATSVYLVPGVPVTDVARMWAGILAATEAGRSPEAPTPIAAITSSSAAWLRGLRPRLPRPLVLVAPHGQSTPRVPGVRIIRSRTLRPGDIEAVRGLPCATLARLLMDLALDAPQSELRALLIDARQRRAPLAPVVARVAEATPFPGRGRLIRSLRQVGADDADSVFAAAVADGLRQAGYTVTAEHAIETPGAVVHADLALVEDQVAIDCDGLGAHSRRESLTADARRANGLALRPDWVVLRVTWDRWTHARDEFLSEVAQAVSLQRASRTPRAQRWA